MLARQGTPSSKALSSLLQHPYFSAPPPKSLDRGAFSLDPVRGLPAGDGAATLVEFTAEAAAMALNWMEPEPDSWLVCGGGRRNPALMDALRRAVLAPVEPIESIGWSGDLLEAYAFAYLGMRALQSRTISAPATTGCVKPAAGGRIEWSGDERHKGGESRLAVQPCWIAGPTRCSASSRHSRLRKYEPKDICANRCKSPPAGSELVHEGRPLTAVKGAQRRFMRRSANCAGHGGVARVHSSAPGCAPCLRSACARSVRSLAWCCSRAAGKEPRDAPTTGPPSGSEPESGRGCGSRLGGRCSRWIAFGASVGCDGAAS